jgi:hypothetical protein
MDSFDSSLENIDN